MKAFECDHCGNLIFFDNVKCLKCEHALGFLPDMMDVTALEPKSEGEWEALTPAAQGRRYRKCANGQEFQVCNWLLPTADANPLCVACRLNTTIPDLVMPETKSDGLNWREPSTTSFTHYCVLDCPWTEFQRRNDSLSNLIFWQIPMRDLRFSPGIRMV